jgi:hypothetical protein
VKEIAGRQAPPDHEQHEHEFNGRRPDPDTVEIGQVGEVKTAKFINGFLERGHNLNLILKVLPHLIHWV